MGVYFYSNLSVKKILISDLFWSYFALIFTTFSLCIRFKCCGGIWELFVVVMMLPISHWLRFCFFVAVLVFFLFYTVVEFWEVILWSVSAKEMLVHSPMFWKFCIYIFLKHASENAMHILKPLRGDRCRYLSRMIMICGTIGCIMVYVMRNWVHVDYQEAFPIVHGKCRETMTAWKGIMFVMPCL